MLKSGARIGKLETAWSERKDAGGTEEGYAGEKVYFKQNTHTILLYMFIDNV